MTAFYQDAAKHHIAVDCIIFGFNEGGLKLLLFERNIEPERGKWSLMGGFVDDNESVNDAAKRVLHNLTGLKEIFMEQLFTYGDVERDPGKRVISVAYYALIRLNDYNDEMAAEHSARWFELSEIPDLIFDHNNMVELALRKLRQKTRYRPIGFELLPKKFTLPQLQQLYEAIYQKNLDKRNFRKKILSMNLIKKLDEKNKDFSKKGAYLYQFDMRKYYRFVEKGFNFEI